MQHVTSLSFLLLAYSNYLSHANKVVPCGRTTANPALLKRIAKRQVTIKNLPSSFELKKLINLRCFFILLQLIIFILILN